MALPVTIHANVQTGPQNSYHGPFKSSGDAFYTVLRNTSAGSSAASLSLWKATDPTSSFAEQDTEVIGNSSFSIQSVNNFQDGDTIHIAVQKGSTAPDVLYTTADLSADTLATEVLVDDTPNGAAHACDITVLSAAYGVGGAFVKIRVVYQGATDMDMGAEMERIDESNSVDDGVNWSAPTQIDNGASVAGVHYTGPRIVLPPSNSDQCHIFMSDSINLCQRAIADDDTLRTYRDTGFDSRRLYGITHGIGFTRVSTSKVRIGYHEFGSNDLEVLEFDAFSDDTNPTETTSNVSPDNVASNVQDLTACLAADGSVIRGLMVKATDDDLYAFDDGGSDTYSISGSADVTGTFNHVSTRVYDRSGTKLAMIYDDGGTVKYDEISVGVADTTISVPQDALTETDNIPALRTGVNVPTPQESLSQADNTPTINTGVIVSAPQDSLTQTDNAPSVPQVVPVPQDSLSQTDNAPDIRTGVAVSVPADAQTQTDNVPGINTGVTVTSPQDSLSQTDNAPTVPQIVGVPVDSLSQVDNVPDIRTGVTVVVPQDALSETDNAPVVRTSIAVPADSLAQTDQVPSINTGVNVATPTDALSEMDNVPAVGTGIIVATPQDNLTQINNVPLVSTGVTIAVPVDTLTQTDHVPTITAADAGFIPYPNPRYTMTGGMQSMSGGV